MSYRVITILRHDSRGTSYKIALRFAHADADPPPAERGGCERRLELRWAER